MHPEVPDSPSISIAAIFSGPSYFIVFSRLFIALSPHSSKLDEYHGHL